MFDLLLITVLTLHLTAMGLAGAGPLVAMALHARHRRGDDAAGELGLAFARASLYSFLFAIVLGSVALFFLWSWHASPWFRAAALVPASRYWFGLLELAFYGAFVAWDIACWRRPVPPRWYARFGWWLLPLFAGTNLLYHFPTLFSVIGVLSTRPSVDGPISFRAAMLDPETLARTVHHWLSAMVIAGVVLAAIAWRRLPITSDPYNARRALSLGARVALAAVLAQFLAGVYLFLQLPNSGREYLSGGAPFTTANFALSVMGSVGLAGLLTMLAIGVARKKEVVGAVVLALLVMWTMAATRHLNRKQTWLRGGQGAAVSPGAPGSAVSQAASSNQ